MCLLGRSCSERLETTTFRNVYHAFYALFMPFSPLPSKHLKFFFFLQSLRLPLRVTAAEGAGELHG